MKIGFEHKSKLLHAYHLPGLHNVLLNYKKFILKEYYNWKTNANKLMENGLVQANVDISNNLINRKLNNIFFNVISKYYIIENSNIDMSNVAIYVQDKNQSVNAYHHHFHQGSLVGTTYINPPISGEGGELEIWDMPYPPMKIQPLKDVIYTFPSWLPHRPLPQNRKEERICLNWVLESNNKLAHKITSDLW